MRFLTAPVCVLFASALAGAKAQLQNMLKTIGILQYNLRVRRLRAGSPAPHRLNSSSRPSLEKLWRASTAPPAAPAASAADIQYIQRQRAAHRTGFSRV